MLDADKTKEKIKLHFVRWASAILIPHSLSSAIISVGCKLDIFLPYDLFFLLAFYSVDSWFSLSRKPIRNELMQGWQSKSSVSDTDIGVINSWLREQFAQFTSSRKHQARTIIWSLNLLKWIAILFVDQYALSSKKLYSMKGIFSFCKLCAFKMQVPSSLIPNLNTACVDTDGAVELLPLQTCCSHYAQKHAPCSEQSAAK